MSSGSATRPIATKAAIASDVVYVARLATPESGILHHVGHWVDDLQREDERLRGSGFPCFMSGPSLAIHRGPGGLMLEPCDVARDRPFLRDLFPVGSALYGESNNSGAA
jgi:hypothetical protein